ncbi:TIGR03759 family integrating conjugative element protein [Testudinibacter sp. P80/BLE/0925]|uniref:TIGR03759 family integrating conjugative element protein n=1 Tax=Testudinibacter sp. TW-1 TaxID=3417757 RepID=UPI003D35F2ED
MMTRAPLKISFALAACWAFALLMPSVVSANSALPVLTLPSVRKHVENIDATVQGAQTQENERTQSKHAQPNHIQSKQWGLDEREWERYETLKRSERGIWSPNLDPLTMLGIEAENELERMKYARLLAKKEFERVEKELKFQLAYDAAFKELYPNINPISEQTMDVNHGQDNGRLVFFTRTENCERCDVALTDVLQSGKAVDIYLVGTSNDDNAVRRWAQKHQIDIEQVKARRITLNHDQGYWFTHANGKMPVVFKGGTWDVVKHY